MSLDPRDFTRSEILHAFGVTEEDLVVVIDNQDYNEARAAYQAEYDALKARITRMAEAGATELEILSNTGPYADDTPTQTPEA